MRQIPEDKPLSPEDRKWLEDWGRHDQIKRIDEANGTDDTTPERQIPEGDLRSLLKSHGIDPGDNDVLDVLKGVLDGTNLTPVGKQVRLGDSAAHVSPDDVANGGGDDTLGGGEPDEDDPDDDYSEWTNDELKEELGHRELSKSGTKPDLVARLRESDAAGYGN